MSNLFDAFHTMAKKKPLKLPQGCLYLMTEIVQHRERRMMALLKDLGLTLHEWRVLRILYSFADDQPMATVIAHSQTDRSALGRTIDRLEERGWVARRPDPDDKRAMYLRVTPASHDVFQQAYDEIAKLDRNLMASLPAQQVAELESGLATIALASL